MSPKVPAAAMRFLNATGSALRNHARNALFLMVPRAGAVVAQIAFLPIVLASLQVKDYGEFALAFSIANFAAIFTFPRITFESKVGLARGQDGTFLYGLFQRWKISVPLIAVCLLVLAASASLLPPKVASLIAITLVGSLGSAIAVQALTNFYIAKERYLTSSLIAFYRSLFVNGGSAWAAYATHSVLIFAATRTAIEVATVSAALAWTVPRYHLWSAYRTGNLDSRVRAYGLRMFGADFVQVLRTFGMSWIVTLFLGVEALAIFNLAFTALYRRVCDQVVPLTSLIYAKSARDTDTLKRIATTRNIAIVSLIGVAAAVGAAAIAYIYIHHFVPPAYSRAFAYFAVLIASLPAALLANFLVVRYTVNLDHVGMTWIGVGPALLQLVLAFTLTYLFGGIGACIAIGVGNIATATMAWAYGRYRPTSTSHLGESGRSPSCANSQGN